MGEVSHQCYTKTFRIDIPCEARVTQKKNFIWRDEAVTAPKPSDISMEPYYYTFVSIDAFSSFYQK